MNPPSARRQFLQGAAGLAGSLPLASALQGNPAHAAEAGHPGVAAGQTRKLAEFAAALRYEDIPAEVLQRARDTIADMVASVMYGGSLPWSKMIAAYAQAYGSGGRSRILGLREASVHAPSAALANGALAHAFELDNLTKPNSGCHPGATAATAALAVGQARGLSGRDLLTAFVAGTEVMIRVGLATRHSQEEHGFHAPGTTGPFGACVAAARIMGLGAAQTQNAIGVAASTASGLLEFAKSGTGAMVKRLHLGRAAESGVLAASLAEKGFTGPATGLEGDFGFLKVLCRDYDMGALTRGLGETWLTQTTMLKRYACHITAHTPVESVLALKAEHGFTGADVVELAVECNERSMRVNNIPQPRDILLGQYSIPFCVALALYRNPVDPRSFDESAVRDSAIMGQAARVRMALLPPPDHRSDMTSVVSIRLKDGRSLSRRTTAFMGTPERPLGRRKLEEKFLLLTRDFGEPDMARVFARIQQLDDEKTLQWIGA